MTLKRKKKESGVVSKRFTRYFCLIVKEQKNAISPKHIKITYVIDLSLAYHPNGIKYKTSSLLKTFFYLLKLNIIHSLIYVYFQLFYFSVLGKHLIFETDPEKGNDEYAFDNPGFKGNTLT